MWVNFCGYTGYIDYETATGMAERANNSQAKIAFHRIVSYIDANHAGAMCVAPVDMVAEYACPRMDFDKFKRTQHEVTQA